MEYNGISNKALEIFKHELAKQLTEVEVISTKQKVTLEDRLLAANTLHTIVGGAGLLGFKAIADAARELERALRGINITTPPQEASLLSKLKLEQLKL